MQRLCSVSAHLIVAVYVVGPWRRAGVMMQPRYAAPAAPHQQQQQPQSAAAVATGYQYYTPVYSQYPSVAAVPPPPATWIQQAAPTPAVTPAVANHYVLPQQLHQLQPAVRPHVGHY